MSDIKTKFINDPENITAELLEGYALAYPNQVKLAAENMIRLTKYRLQAHGRTRRSGDESTSNNRRDAKCAHT